MMNEDLVSVFSEMVEEDVLDFTAACFEDEEKINVKRLKCSLVKGASEVDDAFCGSIKLSSCFDIYIALVNHLYDLNIELELQKHTLNIWREEGDESDFKVKINLDNDYEDLLDEADELLEEEE